MMKVKNQVLFEQFDDFVSQLKTSDKIAIYHDADPDGTCSGVIVAKALERLGKKISMHIGRRKGEHYVSEALAKELCKRKINKLITVDIAADEKPEGLFMLEKWADVLVIDHHKLYTNLNEKNKKIVLLKPQLLYVDVDPQLYCTSKFVFDLFSRHVKLDDLDWVAGVGIIADVTARAWEPFLKEVFKKYNLLLTKEYFNSRLGKVAHVISSAEVFDEKNVPLAFEVVFQAKQPNDVLESVLKKFQKVIEDEIRQLVREVKKNAEIDEKRELIFYFINPKHAITSPLSTILGFKYPTKTVIIASGDGRRVFISARRQDKKIAMNNLLEKAVEGFETTTAGGHIPAAGANFPDKYLAIFKTRIKAILDEVLAQV